MEIKRLLLLIVLLALLFSTASLLGQLATMELLPTFVQGADGGQVSSLAYRKNVVSGDELVVMRGPRILRRRIKAESCPLWEQTVQEIRDRWYG